MKILYEKNYFGSKGMTLKELRQLEINQKLKISTDKSLG